ncbi:MAG: hypothetical protein ACLFP8_03155 [Alphaproteobacteria bacterium]
MSAQKPTADKDGAKTPADDFGAANKVKRNQGAEGLSPDQYDHPDGLGPEDGSPTVVLGYD